MIVLNDTAAMWLAQLVVPELRRSSEWGIKRLPEGQTSANQQVIGNWDSVFRVFAFEPLDFTNLEESKYF